ncbi:RHS repeat domain-containing protein [Terrimonas ferruginea]|uniref:RHS repeat domain-containing protein n=1 Tax=Terrimonas ferruginea TaxID=249 RepID=UPI0004117A68|nr:hypothetical protein [Terrimonas ferruginea]
MTDQLTITVYDEKYNPLSPDPGIAAGIDQQNLRNRVSYSMVKALSTDTWHQTATFYTYDIHGNVNQLLQDYRGVANLPSSDRLKTIKYQYDLVSGKVNEVAYQPGAADGFYHRYAYDAENRITDVETSRDGVYWEHEANYEYYKHGPLARMVLGKELQGVDYAYTIQGWLKGVNGSSLTPDKDMGKDGLNTGTPSVFGRDIYGYVLHYFDNGASENDSYSIGGTGAFARPNNGSFKSLYNGNIGAMTVNNAGLKKGNPSTTNSLPLFYNYSYDQLNRIVGMQAYKGLNESTNVWTPISIDDYQEQTNYDPDGNILWYKRNDAPSVFTGKTQMDNMDYLYYPENNRLRQVTDKPTLTDDYSEDIDDQADPNNYTYDAIGNLKTDVSEGITAINWTVYGKIASVVKSSGTISYAYDASGNRITKTAAGKTTLYIRDASGNVMSVYEVPAANQIEQKELHLYGSSRLGIALKESRATVTDALATGFDPAKTKTQRRGEKFFELSNHLGNVLITLTDKKLQQGKASPNEAELDYFTVDVASATDYYPFGMGMPGRKVESDGYRYGFNGQEKSTELDQNGNSMTAEFWQYDARLARRWNPDPRPVSGVSDYTAFLNNPIFFRDPLGDTTINGEFYENQTNNGVIDNLILKSYIPKEGTKKTLRGAYYDVNLYYHRNSTVYPGQAGWHRAEAYLKQVQDASYDYSRAFGNDDIFVKPFNGSSPDGQHAASQRLNEYLVEMSEANENFYSFIYAGARINSIKTHQSATGKIDPSAINVEDLLLVGLVVKQGAKMFASAMSRKVSMPNSGPIMIAVGAASRAEMIARKFKMNLNSAPTRQVLNSLDETVDSFISKYRKASIRSEMPGEFLNLTVQEALEKGRSTVRKLLIDNRFIK